MKENKVRWKLERKGGESERRDGWALDRALMCHLTEIPPLRRIDLQPDGRARSNGSCARVDGGVAPGSVPIREIAGVSRPAPAEELWASRDEIYLLPKRAGRRVAGPGIESG